MIGGDDFKSGQTKMKSVMVDFLVSTARGRVRARARGYQRTNLVLANVLTYYYY